MTTTSKLRGNLNVFQLAFSIIACNGPLVIVMLSIPVIVASGNGAGAPMTFVVCGTIIGLFAVGFAKMSKHLPNPGAFYAYVTAGLGKPIGLGAAFIAVVCYFFGLVAQYPFAGVIFNLLIHDTYGGPSIPWWLWGMVLLITVAVLGYFRIDLSAKVLSIFLVFELAIILIYDFAVGFRGGANGLTLEPFMPHLALSGSVGIAFLFGIQAYGGFEATAIFREECRDPERTIPRAIVLTITTVAVLFAITAWLYIESYGTDNIVAAAQANPPGSIQSSISTYAGHFLGNVATVLVNTSNFAVILAVHNIVSRYVYNLSHDRILPAWFSGVHGSHGSPHRASVLTSLLTFVGLGPFVLAGADPTKLFTVLLGIFAYCFILLLFTTAIAVPAYMWRKQRAQANWWSSGLAPLLALLGLGTALVLATMNVDLLIGGPHSMVVATFCLVYGVFTAGVVLALVYRRRRPNVYARIGRQDPTPT